MHKVLVSLLAAMALLLPLPAHAQSVESGCVAGPARLATADSPHVLDPVDDTASGFPSRLVDVATDLTRFWVGLQDGTGGSQSRFTANWTVPLDEHPVGAVLLFRPTRTSSRWMWARALATGDWVFEAGFPFVLGYQHHVLLGKEVLVGSVDAEASTVSIDLPSDVLPDYQPDTDVYLDDYIVETYFDWTPLPLEVPAGGTLSGSYSYVTHVDDSGNADVCPALLYEAEDK